MKTTRFIAFLSLAFCCPSSARAQTLEWIRQFGTSSSEIGKVVSADGLGNVYVSGPTYGNLEGTNAGSKDAFISKYDAGGTLQWTRQIGTSENDWGNEVSADGLGNVYISGGTYGILGETSAGGADAFFSKYDASGTLQWTRQLGISSSEGEFSYGVSVDGLGSVYISGYTSGDLWGTNAGGYDAFISKYDVNGTREWIRQLGTSSDDFCLRVSADGLGNAYISGFTFGILGEASAGGEDAFLTKYDASGTLEWTRQLGTGANDASWGVSADGLGNVYMSGTTWGNLGGANAGESDVFVAKYRTAVPEPATGIMLMLAMAAMLFCQQTVVS